MMGETDTISWLLPVRDGARWLGAAVASALAECGPGDEVIVVDDGSRDDPGAALPADPRLRLIRQPPLGIAPALERGRLEARGALLARLDADDVALPGRIAAQREALKDPRLAAVGGRARMIRDDGTVPTGMQAYVDWVNGLGDLHAALLVESPLFHPAVTLRASAVGAVGGWRDGDFPEDYDLWLRLAGAGWGLANVKREVVTLRDRDDRLTRADPRYRRAAFTALKRDWAAAHWLPAGARVCVWGAGKGGKPWIRDLLARGYEVSVVDIRHGGTRQGLPILPTEAVADLDVDYLIAAVGARGARAIIRERIAALRPGWIEGAHWRAVT